MRRAGYGSEEINSPDEVSQVSFVYGNKTKESRRSYPHNKLARHGALSVVPSEAPQGCSIIASEKAHGKLGEYIFRLLLRLRGGSLLATVKKMVVPYYQQSSIDFFP